MNFKKYEKGVIILFKPKRFSKLLTIICFTLIFSFLATGCGSKKLEFKDEKLKEALLSQVKKADDKDKKNADVITNKDVQELTSLILSNKELTDLSGIENIKKLETLDISNNKITDLSVLTNLEALKSLNIQGNQIEDFSK